MRHISINRPTSSTKRALKTLCQGKVNLAGFEVECYVLDTPGKDRVLSRQGVLKAIGRDAKPNTVNERVDEIPGFLRVSNLRSFITSNLVESSKPVYFTAPDGGPVIIGYRTNILKHICSLFMAAHEASALKAPQIRIAERCKLLVRGFATVGLQALVDEATGFQEVKPEDGL